MAGGRLAWSGCTTTAGATRVHLPSNAVSWGSTSSELRNSKGRLGRSDGLGEQPVGANTSEMGETGS